MAREVAVLVWCDVCLKETEEKVEGTHTEIVGIGNVRRQIELCEKHFDSILGGLAQALLTYGGPVDPSVLEPTPSPQPKRGRPPIDSREEYPCPFDDCTSVLSTRSSYSGHLRGMHNTSIAEVEPMPGVVKEPCGYPGCNFIAFNPQGLGAHRRAKHGIAGSSATSLENHRRRQQAESA